MELLAKIFTLASMFKPLHIPIFWTKPEVFTHSSIFGSFIIVLIYIMRSQIIVRVSFLIVSTGSWICKLRGKLSLYLSVKLQAKQSFSFWI